MGIQFKNVSHEYLSIGRSDNAISNINLNIEKEGEFIAILGHTGAGKSTLVQHMNALMYPTSGIVTVFGQDLPPKKRERVNHLRRKVGLVFQFPEYQLFENTIIEDISFGPKNFKETKEHALENAKKAAKQVGLDESMYDKSPFRISGGQMRRVAVAGILAMDPSILVLDEPTRGLDPRGRDEMMEIFNNIHENENKTIVLISHDMDIVSKYAKRMIVLKEGKIVFDGCKEDLFNHKDFDSFNLDLPTPLKMMKYLSKKLNIEYKELYTLDELTSYLKEVKL
ncbi:energy-coupling factor transporter ATPase [Haploplasma modicum]|uniref:energy-coupling factor transporter ATPase n=1 Tax=Haploplasma modicum TaxID=2150 RepID=UPI00214CD4C8|nr:energy-coupling factor transporter ATPase [Haploplasma modicum]MCR1808646.1 energy-coupling factor transporter ATPase [Haploplasma modicum]